MSEIGEAPEHEVRSNTAEDRNPILTPTEAASDAFEEPAGTGGARKPAAAFIFATVSLDMLAFGMIAPVLPRLIESFVHGDASTAAKMLGLFGTVFAAVQFFFSPVLGSLSDRFGRRPIILLSNFGLGLDYLVMAWAPQLSWLFLGRVIAGVTASSVPTAMAYMADVTPAEKRGAAFGMLNAAFGFGFVAGPALGGILGNINPRLPFVVAACLSLLNGAYGLFVLPESLKRENRAPFSWKRANPVGSVMMLSRTRGLLVLSALLLLGYLAQQVLMNVYVLYADYRFHWTDRTVGLSLGLVGVFTILYGGLLVRPFIAKFGERNAIYLGLSGCAVGYTMIGLSRTGALLWMALPVLNLMSLTWPAAQSLMSAGAAKNEQGQLQGAINGIRGAAGIVGPGMFTYIFAKAVGERAIIHLPGLPFFVASGLVVAAIPIAWYGCRVARQTGPSGDQTPQAAPAG